MEQPWESLRQQFYQHFGKEPASMWQSPGRINLMGDHTDYQGGLALPIAVPYSTWVAGRLRDDQTIRGFSDFGQEDIHLEAQFVPSLVRQKPLRGLVGFVAATWDILGLEQGIDLYIASTLPIASGLSSSASLSLGILATVRELFGKSVLPEKMVPDARRIENEYLGVNSGILDPLAIALGRADFALLVDALVQDAHPVPFDYAGKGMSLWIIDTQTPRTLASSGYDQRVWECQQATHMLGVSFLRQATMKAIRGLTDSVLQARARHVVKENQRVRWTVSAAQGGDWDRVKFLFWASHWSLSQDFMVSTPVLDQTVMWLQEMGVGARLTGAGFGGSVIALGDVVQGKEIIRRLTMAYTDKGWQSPRFLEVARPAAGLHKVIPDNIKG